MPKSSEFSPPAASRLRCFTRSMWLCGAYRASTPSTAGAQILGRRLLLCLCHSVSNTSAVWELHLGDAQRLNLLR